MVNNISNNMASNQERTDQDAVVIAERKPKILQAREQACGAAGQWSKGAARGVLKKKMKRFHPWAALKPPRLESESTYTEIKHSCKMLEASLMDGFRGKIPQHSILACTANPYVLVDNFSLAKASNKLSCRVKTTTRHEAGPLPLEKGVGRPQYSFT